MVRSIGFDGLWRVDCGSGLENHASKLNPTLSSYHEPLRIATGAVARNKSQGFKFIHNHNSIERPRQSFISSHTMLLFPPNLRGFIITARFLATLIPGAPIGMPWT